MQNARGAKHRRSFGGPARQAPPLKFTQAASRLVQVFCFSCESARGQES